MYCLQRKLPEQDIAQGSYIALPLTLLLLLAGYNHDKVGQGWLCSYPNVVLSMAVVHCAACGFIGLLSRERYSHSPLIRKAIM